MKIVLSNWIRQLIPLAALVSLPLSVNADIFTGKGDMFVTVWTQEQEDVALRAIRMVVPGYNGI